MAADDAQNLENALKSEQSDSLKVSRKLLNHLSPGSGDRAPTIQTHRGGASDSIEGDAQEHPPEDVLQSPGLKARKALSQEAFTINGSVSESNTADRSSSLPDVGANPRTNAGTVFGGDTSLSEPHLSDKLVEPGLRATNSSQGSAAITDAGLTGASQGLARDVAKPGNHQINDLNKDGQSAVEQQGAEQPVLTKKDPSIGQQLQAGNSDVQTSPQQIDDTPVGINQEPAGDPNIRKLIESVGTDVKTSESDQGQTASDSQSGRSSGDLGSSDRHTALEQISKDIASKDFSGKNEAAQVLASQVPDKTDLEKIVEQKPPSAAGDTTSAAEGGGLSEQTQTKGTLVSSREAQPAEGQTSGGTNQSNATPSMPKVEGRYADSSGSGAGDSGGKTYSGRSEVAPSNRTPAVQDSPVQEEPAAETSTTSRKAPLRASPTGSVSPNLPTGDPAGGKASIGHRDGSAQPGAPVSADGRRQDTVSHELQQNSAPLPAKVMPIQDSPPPMETRQPDETADTHKAKRWPSEFATPRYVSGQSGEPVQTEQRVDTPRAPRRPAGGGNFERDTAGGNLGGMSMSQALKSPADVPRTTARGAGVVPTAKAPSALPFSEGSPERTTAAGPKGTVAADGGAIQRSSQASNGVPGPRPGGDSKTMVGGGPTHGDAMAAPPGLAVNQSGRAIDVHGAGAMAAIPGLAVNQSGRAIDVHGAGPMHSGSENQPAGRAVEPGSLGAINPGAPNQPGGKTAGDAISGRPPLTGAQGIPGVDGQVPGLAPPKPGLDAGSLGAGKVPTSLTGKPGVQVPGVKGAAVPIPGGRGIINNRLGQSDKREFTGAEIALAALIASAATSRVRPDALPVLKGKNVVRQGDSSGKKPPAPKTTGELADDKVKNELRMPAVDEADKESVLPSEEEAVADELMPGLLPELHVEGDAITLNRAKSGEGDLDAVSAGEADSSSSPAGLQAVTLRPKVLVSNQDTLVSLAEGLFQDSNLGWLIADLNRDQLKESWIDGKRVIEISARQEIQIPVWQDIVEFYQNRPEEALPENLVTIVVETQLNRELLDTTLAVAMGLGSPVLPGHAAQSPVGQRQGTYNPALSQTAGLLGPETARLDWVLKAGRNLQTFVSKLPASANEAFGSMTNRWPRPPAAPIGPTFGQAVNLPEEENR